MRNDATSLPSSVGKRHARGLRQFGWLARAEVWLLGTLGWLLLKSIELTARVETHGDDVVSERWRKGEPTIFAFWHGRLSMLTYFYRGNGAFVLHSNHRDGRIVARALRPYGIHCIGGSSSRGAITALRSLFRAFQGGNDIALVPDGPRGPAGVAKPGAVELSMTTGAPLFPIAASASRSFRAKGWDRMMIPLPWARIAIVVGEPVTPPASTTNGSRKEARERMRVELEERLRELCRRADGYVGRVPEET